MYLKITYWRSLLADGVSVTLDDAEFQQEIRDLISALDDPRAALAQVAQYLQDVTVNAFDTETDPETGRRWEDLSQQRQQQRLRKGRLPNSNKLKDTGNLFNSIIAFFDSRTAGVGTNVSYGSDHQFGRPSRNLPARPFLGASDSDKDNILEIFASFIERQ